MKLHPIYSIFVLFPFFFSCQSEVDKPAPINEVVELPTQNKVEEVVEVLPEQARAEKAVVDWIKANSYDPTNYESVGFGVLDSVIEFREEIQKANAIIFEETVSESAGNPPSKLNLDSLKKLVEGAEKEFMGYGIEHKARGKNQFGTPEVTTYIFYFDTTLNVTHHLIKEAASNTSNPGEHSH